MSLTHPLTHQNVTQAIAWKKRASSFPNSRMSAKCGCMRHCCAAAQQMPRRGRRKSERAAKARSPAGGSTQQLHGGCNAREGVEELCAVQRCAALATRPGQTRQAASNGDAGRLNNLTTLSRRLARARWTSYTTRTAEKCRNAKRRVLGRRRSTRRSGGGSQHRLTA